MDQQPVAQTILSVPDVSCAHCVRTITTTLSPLDGVSDVVVDIPGKTVRVTYNPARIDVARLAAALADEDYPVAAAS